jgi:hypothetical protein
MNIMNIEMKFTEMFIHVNWRETLRTAKGNGRRSARGASE